MLIMVFPDERCFSGSDILFLPPSHNEILVQEVCSADSLAERASQKTTLPSWDRVGTVHAGTVHSDRDWALSAFFPRVRKECQTPA